MRLFCAARVVVDVALHTQRMTREAAAAYLVAEAGVDPGTAVAEVARYTDNPTGPMSHLKGYLLIEGLAAKRRAALGAQFSSREFLDEILSFGAVPLPAIAKGMGL